MHPGIGLPFNGKDAMRSGFPGSDASTAINRAGLVSVRQIRHSKIVQNMAYFNPMNGGNPAGADILYPPPDS